jgi:hypothetical protein
MRTEHSVGRPKGVRNTYRDRFLTYTKVNRPTDLTGLPHLREMPFHPSDQ